MGLWFEYIQRGRKRWDGGQGDINGEANGHAIGEEEDENHADGNTDDERTGLLANER